MSIYADQIRQILSQEISSDITFYSNVTIQNLINQIDAYLKELALWNKRTTAYFNKIVTNDPHLKDETKKYIATKQMIQKAPEIESLLKDGHMIIDILREKITQEKIEYFVGVEYRGKLYEGYLTLEQILNIAKIVPNWKGSLNSLVKLRLSGINKSNLSQLLSYSNNVDDSTHSTLYSSVRNYASKSGKTNEGNVYEAYRTLVQKYRSNTIPPARWDPNEFDEVYLNVRKNTGSFVTGGDILNEQIKFFGGSSPSLVSLSTIKNTLTDFKNFLQNLSGSNLKDALEKLFYDKKEIQNSSTIIDNIIDETVNNLLTDL